MQLLRCAIIAPFLWMIGVSPVAAESLDGGRWILSVLPAEELLERITVTLNFDDGRVTGTDGCNRFQGTYAFKGDELHIGTLASTMMGCPDPVMRQARAYTAALEQARSAEIAGEMLQLFDSDGELLAEFEPQLQALAGTRWDVSGYNNGKQAVVSADPDTPMTIEFDAKNGISGTAGCNNFRGQYSSDSDTLAVEDVAATRRLCQDAVMDQENAFLEALSRSATWRAEGNRLEVRDDGGAMQVIASRADSGSSQD